MFDLLKFLIRVISDLILPHRIPYPQSGDFEDMGFHGEGSQIQLQYGWL